MTIKSIKIEKTHDNHIGLQNGVHLFLYIHTLKLYIYIYIHNSTQIHFRSINMAPGIRLRLSWSCTPRVIYVAYPCLAWEEFSWNFRVSTASGDAWNLSSPSSNLPRTKHEPIKKLFWKHYGCLLYLGDEILPIYVGIVVNNYKDLY